MEISCEGRKARYERREFCHRSRSPPRDAGRGHSAAALFLLSKTELGHEGNPPAHGAAGAACQRLAEMSELSSEMRPLAIDARIRVHTLPATVDIAGIKTVAIHDAKPVTLLSGSL